MKTNIKITLLVLAVIGCLGGVLLFAQYIMDPPMNLALVNCHRKTIETDIEKMGTDKKALLTDTLVDDMMTRMAFYKSEKFLDDKDCDAIVDKFVDKYVPAISKVADELIKASSCDVSDLAGISKRVGLLKDLKIAGKPAVETDKIKTAVKIADNYNEAKKLIDSKNHFSSYSSAKSVCDKVKSVMSMEGVKACSSLVSSLKEVPAKLGEAHYKYVKSLVASLGHGHKSASDVLAKVKEYKGASHVYGSVHSVSDLESKCNSYLKPRKETHHHNYDDDYYISPRHSRQDYEDYDFDI